MEPCAAAGYIVLYPAWKTAAEPQRQNRCVSAVHDQRSVLCDQAERNKRTGAWVEAVNLMHPHWDGADTQDQKTVLKNVKTEQPVQDRCKKRKLEDKQSALSPQGEEVSLLQGATVSAQNPRVKTNPRQHFTHKQ
ncbi:unnamed protein product [Ranitomeya imitator]|uniref:Uncharacterized protein n=1 Tax=Ranitomeya imitator TaxID=111125 RepID=A0ABN9LCC2_9NEOB|nr:unnamed protein product [Ranitomeya imitator]